MLEKNANPNTGESAIKRIKEHNMLKKQRLAIIMMIAAIALLVVALLVVNYLVQIYTYDDLDGTRYQIKKVNGYYELCYKGGDPCDRNSDGYYQTDLGTLVQIDPATGEAKTYAVVHTSETEEVGYAQYVLMFKQLTYDASSTKDSSKVIKSIEVHNEYGSYTFDRGEGNNFFIVGNESAPFDKETFAKLSVACGYTLSMRRLENPKMLADNSGVDYAEYGLVAQTRTRTETDDEGNEIEVEYEYEPAWYVITTMTGESHKVIIGDMVVSGTGYYAQYEGRDTIYVLGSSGIQDVMLQRVETLVTPSIVYPMGLTDYFNVADFRIISDIDYDAIVAALEEKYGDPDKLTEGEIDAEEFYKYYDEVFQKYSKTMCHFSYQDLEERQGSMYSYLPYVSNLEYTDGYYINSSNIDQVLYSLYDTDFTEVVKLSPTDEDFEKYGLDVAPHVISYLYKTTDEEGKEYYVQNYVEISARTEAGVYYAYSSMYDMIVGVSESSFDFLEWEEISWYDTSYIQLDISHVTDIIIESPEISVHYELEDSASKYMTYFEKSGSTFKVGTTSYSITKDLASGKYVLTCGGSKLSPIYKGDYLVAPLVYSKGVAQAENYLFVETSDIDANGDGENDSTAYYFYNVVNNNGTYYLAAQISLADYQGNKLTEDRAMLGEPYLETSFFITNSGYLYLTNKNSYMGMQLEERYGSVNRGRWGKGNLFVTASDQYVLVNAETGEWSIIDDISCGIYYGDKDTSRLAERAVEIPAKYDSTGKLTRHPEVYYPTTEEKLRYDEETGAIQVYDSTNKIWEKATYSDCTIGIWNTGAYYLTENNQLVIVNEVTGDWGYITLATNEIYVCDVIADGSVLDYNIKTTNHVGRVVNTNTMSNFKQFYGAMLYASFEGMAELSDEEKAAFRQLDNFTSDDADNPCQLKITILGYDLYGNRRDTVYRFYQYTERKSYITVEALSTPDPSTSDSTKAYGNFYVLRTFADKIIEDAKRILNAEEVTAVSKY
ncbi:MAG: hypothetical protein IJY39_09315 [Clostridia bacterium]|nr:hypothetical protein [Clostridia bacterium]